MPHEDMTRTPRLMSSPDSVLKSVFGFDAFRPGQKGVINCIMSEQNVLAVMPTGAGKSLCYQVPALMLEGITVVISPLVALMDNQVAALRANGVSVAFLLPAIFYECFHLYVYFVFAFADEIPHSSARLCDVRSHHDIRLRQA